MENILQKRASNLFKYIKSVLKSNLKVQTTFDKKQFIKSDNFQENKYISSFFNHPEQNEFFIIKYPNIETPPAYPISLEGWIYNYPNNPTLKMEPNEENLDEIITRNEQREKIWADFKPKYEDWKFKNEEKLKVENLFRCLYNLSIQRDENYEFVLGHGIISWEINNQIRKTTLNYPLVTIEISITYDASSKTLVIEPIEDKTFILEDLVIQEYVDNLIDIKKIFANIEYDITEKSSYLSLFENVLNRFINPIDKSLANGKIIEDPQANPFIPNQELKIFDNWGLLYRKRRQNAELNDLENYINILDNNANINDSSIVPFLEDAKTEIENFNVEKYNEINVLQDKKILFPLPFNEEQINILNKIENSKSVIVLGPPGTGKSHTIANLVSHFLAKGQRVLVTSQKDQALDVLLNKLPEELRKFCIPILSTVPDGKKKMVEAFNGMNQAVSYSDSYLDHEIDLINDNIDKTKEELINTQQKIKLGCKFQLNKIKFKNEFLLPIEIIKYLKEDEKQHSWLKDNVKYTTAEDIDGNTIIRVEFPIEESELKRLVDLKLELNEKLMLLSQKRVSTTLLLTPNEFEEFSKNLLKMNNCKDQISSCIPDLFFKNVSADDLQAFMNLLKFEIDNKSKIKQEWQNNIFEILQDEIEGERLIGQINSISIICDKLVEAYKEFDIFDEINITSSLSLIELKTFILKAISKVRKGEDIYNIKNSFLLAKTEKLTLKNIFINNTKPKSQNDFKIIFHYIKLLLLAEKLSRKWNKVAKRYKLPFSNLDTYKSEINQKCMMNKYILDEDNYKNLITLISESIALINLKKNERNISELAPLLFENCDYIIKKYPKELLLKAIEYKLSSDSYASTKTKYESLKNSLTVNLNDCELNVELYSALNLIQTDTEQAILIWSKVYNELKELELSEEKYSEFLNLLNKLEKKAPIWKEHILKNNGDFYPSYWQKSFEHNAITSYISNINRFAKDLNLYEKRLSSLSNKLRSLKVELIIKTTIKNIKSKMSNDKLRALEEWQMALKKMGKGKSKLAATRIRQLKEATQKAKSSIPVWIMPLYKVSETIPSDIGLFDVVIIDEASQSDIRAFLALIRGKKVIIVGDPEQVSPINIGGNVFQIQDKIKEYLQDIPAGQFYDLKTSIYDIAKMTLGGNNVLMLKEHFRCLPEIIRFSNDLCYHGEIIPLRYVSSNKKLDPVLENIYVANGARRDSSDVNENEAIIICKKIQDIIKKEEYKGKTIGVISLTGNDQAKYIESILSTYVSTDEQISHNIRIGDAAAFQGDERDVILLSMVVSSNDTKRYVPLTQDMYKQRFNVAVSRARDKIILVHSIKQDEITNPNCMRYKLLDFINSGQITDKKIRDKNLFESEFEEVVYNSFVNKGYIVTPQVKIGPYRIDLVIEGENNRLGIECDGDRYHPPSKWFEDSQRQKHLERMGWNIYRIWGSDFYNRKEEIVEDIVNNLNKMGIYPQNKYKDDLIKA